MCQRFMNDFVDKVVERAICCDSCKVFYKVCQGPRNFTYYEDHICEYIDGSLYAACQFEYQLTEKDIKTTYDAVLSSLHNNNIVLAISLIKNRFSQLKFTDELLDKIKEHEKCIFSIDVFQYEGRINSYHLTNKSSGGNYKLSFDEWFAILKGEI